MLTKTQKEQIREQAEKELNQELEAARAKKANKGKGKKGNKGNSGREVIIDTNLVNTFNARIATMGIKKQLRGDIASAKININDVEIVMTRQPKVKDTDTVRYKVVGGHGTDLVAPKGDAIICLSERTVLTKRNLDQ